MRGKGRPNHSWLLGDQGESNALVTGCPLFQGALLTGTVLLASLLRSHMTALLWLLRREGLAQAHRAYR